MGERPRRWARRIGALLLVAASLGCGGAEAGRSADAPAQDGAEAGAASTPKVLLIGIDGVRPDVLAAVETPNLDRLAAGGFYTSTTTTTTPSVSGPSWSSMLTGVWPEKHGVSSNDFTAPRYDAYPDFLTRIEDARPELTTAAVVDWLPLMELAEGRALVGPDVDLREALDGYEVGWIEGDARSVELAVRHLRDSDPDALFVYLGNPDETSHEHGSIGAEYRGAIAAADAQVGRLVEAVEARPDHAAEDWLILVSTDHGRRVDGGHGGDSPEEMTTFILAAGPSVSREPARRPTFIVDVAATTLAHLGIELDPSWDLDGRPVGLR